MSILRRLPPTVVLAVLFLGTPLRAQEQPPHELPARDVDISYQITRPHQPRIIQRRRWLASERLVRIDGPDKSATIYDRNAHEIILLNLAKHTYLKLEGTPRLPLDPERGKALKRGNESVVAGFPCLDWSWIEDVETHTVCLTSDGVLLRLVVDGSNLMQARSVSYSQQPPELFQVPQTYEPALAPGGGPGQ